MLNVTKLSIWPELKKLGFIRINYRFNGKLYTVGAALQQEHIDGKGQSFKSDIITIAPHHYTDKKRYHITGTIKTPYYQELYRIDGIGRKEKIYELQEHMNEFFTARDILKTVQLMLQ